MSEASGRMEALAWFKEQVPAQLAAVFEGLTGEAPKVEWANEGTTPDAAFCWRQPFQPGHDAVLWIGVPADTERVIGRAVLEEESPSAETRGTVREALGQLASSLARLAGARAGKEITPAAGDEKVEWPVTGVNSLVIRIGIAEATALLRLGWSDGLLSMMTPPPPAAVQTAPVAAGKAAEPVAPPSRTMDLLLDVEMPVSISFGRAQLPLREVIKLSCGSIVELNRAIAEPVEVIVNNCVIARGEVVVIEGNYGVKIQQIISRQERLRTLH